MNNYTSDRACQHIQVTVRQITEDMYSLEIPSSYFEKLESQAILWNLESIESPISEFYILDELDKILLEAFAIRCTSRVGSETFTLATGDIDLFIQNYIESLDLLSEEGKYLMLRNFMLRLKVLEIKEYLERCYKATYHAPGH